MPKPSKPDASVPSAPASDTPTREQRIAALAAERRKASMGALSVEDAIAVATAQVEADEAAPPAA